MSAWEAFNGVQGYVQHDMSRHGRPDTFTRAIVALDDQAVSRALGICAGRLVTTDNGRQKRKAAANCRPLLFNFGDELWELNTSTAMVTW